MGQRATFEDKDTPCRILVVFPFEGISSEQIRAAGKGVIPDGLSAPEGRNEQRARAYYAGRAALKFAFEYLERKLFVRPAEGFGYLEVLDSRSCLVHGIYANVTHTESMAVAAVGDFPIGIDVERLDRPVGNVINRIASPEEVRQADQWKIELDGKRVPSGIALWCAKEAYSKALGLGLGRTLDKVQLQFDRNTVSVVSTLIGPQTLDQPSIEFQLYQDYLIALCCDQKAFRGGFQRLLFGMEAF
ncbi:MAG: 4-phosphopantetheinyl transferase family protein [Bdellovibrionaceae bacterium]|nr:4-phosphopantetheinyl transferase family protein [Bdellovibrionales bacterium]MCB9253612.1 4-phosphopantetheinyl transferase family protein [Pseudobdellovibrionaceae bacterium]